AVKALVSTFTAFGDEAGTAQEISEKFFTAQKLGVTTVGKLATEFNKVAGVAKNLGISFDETLAALSSLTADGAKPTAEAATQLKAAFDAIILVQNKLAKESPAVQDALSLTNVKNRGLVKSLHLLKEATGGSLPEIQRLVGSSQALGVVLSLTGAQSELVAKQIEAIGNASERSATFQNALTTKQKTLDETMKRLNRSVEAIAITFGAAFAPAISAAAKALSSIAQSVAKMDDKTVSLIATTVAITTALTALVAVVAAVALGYLKLKAVFIAMNVALGVGTKLQTVYNFTLGVGRKALQLFRLGMIAATTTVRGFAAATGIGLLLVALSLAITHFKEFKAVLAGTMAAGKVVVTDFVKTGARLFGAYGKLLAGIFTFDLGKIKSSLGTLHETLTTGFGDIGAAGAEAFQTAFNESLAQDTAEEAKQKEAEKQEAIAEAKAEALETQKEIDEEENALKAEAQAEKDAAELARVQTVEAEKDAAKKAVEDEKKKRDDAARKQFLKDEAKHDTTIATFKKFMNNEEVKGVLATNDQLARLASSKNSTLKGIGKAASLVQIGIKTAEGAISAYSSLAGIPIVGPALGIGAATALTLFGAEQAATVARAAQGGIVPGALGGSRDRQMTLTEPGELIVPKSITPDFIQSIGRPEISDEETGGGGSTEVIVGFKDEAFEIIEQKLLERRALGTGGL
ncbi:MAG: phage tail tape measure protein, partial [Epsilonproteobacteria bacterium]